MNYYIVAQFQQKLLTYKEYSSIYFHKISCMSFFISFFREEDDSSLYISLTA